MAAPEGRELQRRESSHMAYDEDWNPDYASMSLEVLQEELQRVRCSAPKLGIADTGRLLMKAGDQVKNLLSPRSSSDTPQQTVSSEKATEAATQIEHLIIPLLRKAGRMKDALEIAKASEASVRAAYGNAHPYSALIPLRRVRVCVAIRGPDARLGGFGDFQGVLHAAGLS
eukprot:Transcript_26084.p3 GENE.Transcript_26084~~Transcript_26084.p3  ORF type:complete len:171 (+),score=36.88 Transcript_26084:66-578(+)